MKRRKGSRTAAKLVRLRRRRLYQRLSTSLLMAFLRRWGLVGFFLFLIALYLSL